VFVSNKIVLTKQQKLDQFRCDF